MSSRRTGRERGSERRRKLAELNLLSEHRVKAPSRPRGCALPVLGIAVSLGGIAVVLAATHHL